jgi:hypothetical protein
MDLHSSSSLLMQLPQQICGGEPDASYPMAALTVLSIKWRLCMGGLQSFCTPNSYACGCQRIQWPCSRVRQLVSITTGNRRCSGLGLEVAQATARQPQRTSICIQAAASQVCRWRRSVTGPQVLSMHCQQRHFKQRSKPHRGGSVSHDYVQLSRS